MMKLELKKLGIDIKREVEKYQNYHLEKLISINILQVKKYYLLVKVE